MKIERRFLRFCTIAVPFLMCVLDNLAPCSAAQAALAHGEQVWLAVSDIHLNLFDRSRRPSPYRSDTNPALFESAIERMKRAAPNATVILLPGDFLAHNIARHVRGTGETPEKAGAQTMQWIAEAFNRAFPTAQFAIAIGNNDIPCGDYRSAAGSAYLATVARTWAPMVNRGGASPDFASSFRSGAYYAANLPLHGLRLFVLDTVRLSSQYRGDCRGNDSQSAAGELAWLQSRLRSGPAGVRNIVMMHIPPGFDVVSTDYVQKLFAWPFLKPEYNAGLVDALATPRNRVDYAIAGHLHRFDFRLAGNVPIVVLGSLSPIYGNDPTFNVLHVSADGSLRDIDVYAFDEYVQAWIGPRRFDRTWESSRIDASTLERLHARLARDASARSRWNYQAEGWPTYLKDSPGGWGERRWLVAWCAQTFLGSGFAQCAGIQRREYILSVIFVLLAAALAALLVHMSRLRRKQRS
jgi:Calcineurin-like phosphoesterase